MYDIGLLKHVIAAAGHSRVHAMYGIALTKSMVDNGDFTVLLTAATAKTFSPCNLRKLKRYNEASLHPCLLQQCQLADTSVNYSTRQAW